MRNEKWVSGSLVSSGPPFLDSWNPLGCVCLLAQWEVLSRPGFAAMVLPVFLHLSAPVFSICFVADESLLHFLFHVNRMGWTEPEQAIQEGLFLFLQCNCHFWFRILLGSAQGLLVGRGLSLLWVLSHPWLLWDGRNLGVHGGMKVCCFVYLFFPNGWWCWIYFSMLNLLAISYLNECLFCLLPIFFLNLGKVDLWKFFRRLFFKVVTLARTESILKGGSDKKKVF